MFVHPIKFLLEFSLSTLIYLEKANNVILFAEKIADSSTG